MYIHTKEKVQRRSLIYVCGAAKYFVLKMTQFSSTSAGDIALTGGIPACVNWMKTT